MDIHAIKFFGNIHLFHLKSSKKNFPAVMKHSYGSVKISLGGETWPQNRKSSWSESRQKRKSKSNRFTAISILWHLKVVWFKMNQTAQSTVHGRRSLRNMEHPKVMFTVQSNLQKVWKLRRRQYPERRKKSWVERSGQATVKFPRLQRFQRKSVPKLWQSFVSLKANGIPVSRIRILRLQRTMSL